MGSDLPTDVLGALDSASSLPLVSTDAFPTVPATSLKGALDSLLSREMVTYETIDKEVAVLTDEGVDIVQRGSHEAKVYEAVCNAVEGLKISELAVGHTPIDGWRYVGRSGVLSAEGRTESCRCGQREGGTGKGVQGGMD